MKDIVIKGYTFGDSTDWIDTLRDAVRDVAGSPWLRTDIDPASALADFIETFRGTSAWSKIAEAALALIESGNDAEREVVWQLQWHEAPNALERLLAMISRAPARLEAIRGVEYVLWRLLPMHSTEPRLLGLLRELRKERPTDTFVQQVAARFLPAE